ncbi:hypothetical protein SAMN04489722_1063 [Algibacter lectus]|uniref:hypothetical protein n=1 Tax=Algibacter lectus TaxID=221126 RepID=UPI0008DF9FBA|nr:hypothetical protein [Algibacter lectus]SFD18760.1 hypothetical protein SAMN04489722_1063 [Algibacter lectus]
MIKNFNDFANYKYQVSNEDIFSDNLELGISGIKYDSKTLLVLPRNKNLGPINQYRELEFIEFNNYDLNDTEVKILNENEEVLEKVKYLSFWNTKLFDLTLLNIFKNVEFLSISHITDPDFTFNGIRDLSQLKTLCLLKTGKVKDLTSLNFNDSIENLSIIQPTNIKDTIGIGKLNNLKYLNIEGSYDKTYKLEKLNELDKLPSLEKIELTRIKIPQKELITALNLPFQIELKIDTNLYSTQEYKELSLELKNVNSNAFTPLYRK